MAKRDELRESSNVASATLLATTNSFVVFSSILPPFSDVRRSSFDDPEMRADVRMGEFAASALALAIGIVASSISNSRAPLIASAVGAAGLVFMYESILRSGDSHLSPVELSSDF